MKLFRHCRDFIFLFVVGQVVSAETRPAASPESTAEVAPVYLVWNAETTLDLPAQEVWPYVVDFPSWQNYSRVEHVSGKPGREGEVRLLQNAEKGFEVPPFYARTIKLEPGHRIVWKCYPSLKETGKEFIGFAEFRLDEEQGRTRFSYSILYEFQMPRSNEIEREAFLKQQHENMDALFALFVPRLKRLVEKRT